MDLRQLLTEVRTERRRLAESDSSMAALAMRELEPYLRGDFVALNRASGGGGLELPAEQAKATLRGLERGTQQREYARRQANKFDVEYHKKIAIPVACLVFVVIGSSLGVRTRRSGYGFAIGVSLLIFTVYYIFLIGGEDLSDRLFVPPWVAMWGPNILFTVLGVILFRRTLNEQTGFLRRRRLQRGRGPLPPPPAADRRRDVPEPAGV
jgi:hypothetical protein